MIRKILILFAFIFFSKSDFAQNAETIHLHLDKEIYLPGETIWFKAYVFPKNGAATTSTNFYAGIYNPEGKLLSKKHYPLFGGTCNGEFEIPDSLSYSALQLIVFTKNSLGNDSSNFYTRIIKLYQKKEVEKEGFLVLEESTLLEFFSEGGTMVSGIPNYVGIKASNNNHSPISVNAAIIENISNKIIDSVNILADGLGKFQFTPENGKKYHIIWPDHSGKMNQQELPTAIENGVGLHSEIKTDKLYYSIQKKTNLRRFEKLNLFVKMGTEILYKESILLKNNQQFVNSFSIDSLPSGILQLILTDDDQNILQAKSIAILHRNNAPQINIIEKNMSAKGKNIIDLWIPDTLLNNLSLSIADLDFYQTNGSPSIYDELLLANNRQFLNYNFGDAVQMNDEKKKDLILQTSNLNTSSENINTINDNYLSLLIHSQNNKNDFLSNTMLTMIVDDKGTGKQFLTLTPSSHSDFSKSGLIFYDSAKVYFKIANNKETSEKLLLTKEGDVKMPEQIKAMTLLKEIRQGSAFISAEILETYVTKKPEKFNEVQTIQAVVLKSRYINPITKRIAEIDKKYTSGMFSGLARGYQLNVLDDPDAANQLDIFNYIKYRIPGLTVSSGGKTMIREFKTNRDFDGASVLLFINETESSYDMLESLPVSQVAYVKYISGIVIGSSFVSQNGALYIYTKRGDEPGASNTTAMNTTMVKGYDISKEFSTPDYSEKTTLVNPDYRSTLYWNPYIITDKDNHKIRIEYYNNDIATKHLLILKGFAEDGSLIEIKKIIE